MESVEFLMLTDVRIAFVALPRSLLARPVSHENIAGASLSCPESIWARNFYYPVFKCSRFVFRGLEEMDPSPTISLWVSPKT